MNDAHHWITIQHTNDVSFVLTDESILTYCLKVLKDESQLAHITVRLVNKSEMTALNLKYRNIDKPTNVLAFPANLPDFLSEKMNVLGDVVICPEVLEEERHLLNKPSSDHATHILIHGVLHLLGYDHIKDEDKHKMQAKEIFILEQLGIHNPY